MHRIARYALPLIAALALPASASAAGAIVGPQDAPERALGLRVAIAITPEGTTRWAEVTLPAGPAVGWLVPVRPGATVEWGSSAWLSALDGASSPHVLPPAAPLHCRPGETFDRTPAWVRPATRLPSSVASLQTSIVETDAWARARGLTIHGAEAIRLEALYRSGWQVAAIELAPSDVARTSPTLRVTDDGGATLPLALGVFARATPITLYVLGAGDAVVGGARDLDRALVRWGTSQSSYAELREDTVARSAGWVREVASHGALFEPVSLGTSSRLRPVAAEYLPDASCAAAVQALGARTDALPASAFTCGGRTDLGLALAGTPPARAVLTRFVGVLPAGGGENVSVALGEGPDLPAVFPAAVFEACGPAPSGPGTTAPRPTEPDPPSRPARPSSSGAGGSSASSSTVEGTVYYPPSDGCGGGTVVTDSSSDTSDDSAWDSGGSGEGCGGDTSGDGWDTGDSDDDTTSDTSDGWDSSDSSDACAGDTSDTSDGWDSSDSSSSCSTAKTRRRRGPSPLSRVVIVAVALLLPLRRRLRPSTGDRS